MSLQSGGMDWVTSLRSQMKNGKVLWKNSESSWGPLALTMPLLERSLIRWDNFIAKLRNVKKFFRLSVARDSFSVSSGFVQLGTLLGHKILLSKGYCFLLSKEDRREFVLTRSFSSARSTITLCSRNKPNSSINVQWKVCDQKIGSFVSKLQSACFAFHEKASRTSEKTCANSVHSRSYFSHAFQVLFSSLF